MRIHTSLAVLAALAAVSSAGAQGRPSDQQKPTVTDSTIRIVFGLPKVVDEARRAGIPDSSIRVVLDSLRKRRVPAEETGTILRNEVEAVKGGAPKENFGATVQALLARGLRGRELAEAIHAEHGRRGIGHGSHGQAKPEGGPQQERPAGDTTKGRRRGGTQ
jgi:hypothetical protein